MSSKTCTWMVLVPLFVAAVAVSLAAAQDRDEPVLKFYWDRARAAMDSRDPLAHGVAYSFTATTYYKKIGKLGEISLADSLKTAYHYSFGKLDSSRTLCKPRHSVPKIELTLPHVFDSAYILNFFPNDTGGKVLAIGFESDSLHSSWPVGLAIIDRQRYTPQWLYLSYPHESGFRSLSRSFRMTEFEGFVFPDSVWEVGVVDGILWSTRYRLETRISDLKIQRQVRPAERP